LIIRKQKKSAKKVSPPDQKDSSMYFMNNKN